MPRKLFSMVRYRPLMAGLAALTVSACAATGPIAGDAPPAGPLAYDEISAAGAYLAGRHADRTRDVKQASRLMDRVLELQQDGLALKRRAFMLRLDDGRFDAAAPLAEEVAATLNGDAPVANLFLAVESARDGDFTAAQNRIERLPDNRLNRILRPLLEGWIALGLGDLERADAAIDGVRDIDGFSALHALHAALLADAAGETELARDRYTKALASLDRPPLRIRLTVADFLARHGTLEEAMAVALQGGNGVADPGDVRRHVMAVSEAGGSGPTAADGLAQAFFDLASALQRDRRSELAMILARFSRRLDPGFDLTTLLVAEILDDRGQYADALEIYDSLSDESAYRLMADLRAVSSLEDLGRTDEAAARLERAAAERRSLTDPLVRLGDLYRAQEEWTKAVDAYDRALARIVQEEPADWSLFYSRGIALERASQWPRAESDFLKALELRPDQPYVLNYLGYTWVDQGQNLDRATSMIERAVELRPNDGYIVDSLGWAMYRLGRFREAVVHLERAVELRPVDPTINDHLGDAYWRVGREAEARFQWRRALNFGADESLAAIIEDKLKSGLPDQESRTVRVGAAGADVEG